MPLRGAGNCIVRIWLDIWFWAKHMDMDTRQQIDQISWNAANVYSLPKKQLRHDLKMWGFEKTLSKELARDIVKARKIALRCNKGRSGVSMVLERVFERYSQDSYGSHTFSII
jgi:hypothetical protein